MVEADIVPGTAKKKTVGCQGDLGKVAKTETIMKQVYYRLEVGIAGTVGMKRWNGNDWQD